jgi:hypothetical protein
MRTIAAFLALGLLAVSGARPADAVALNPCQFLPVVIDVEASGTRYRTEVSFTNPNRDPQEIAVLYTASLGRVEGTGEGRFSVPGGQQLLALDAVEYLRGLGIGIQESGPETPQGGTLRVCNLSPGEIPIGVMARVTAPTRPPYAAGLAGVSFAAVPADEGLTGRAIVFGFHQSAQDRTNVALYNPGAEPVSVSVTLHSGTSEARVVLSEQEDLAGYGWRQFTFPAGRTLPIDQGFVRIERVSKTGFFGAYGVVNDNDTNDGSFIPAVAEDEARTSWMIPVMVDSSAYRSELTLANAGDVNATFTLQYLDSVTRSGLPLSATLSLPARRQVIVPDVFDLFRSGPSGGEIVTSAGTLRVQAAEGEVTGAFAGIRVLTRQERGRFGVFAPAFSPTSADAAQGFLWGLRADAQTRSNVAVLNANASSGETITLQLQVFDGASGRPAGAPLTVTLAPGQWAQPDGFFARSEATNGDVRIVRVGGSGPWWAYGVVNDGSAPGEGTGDGSFVPIVFSGAPAALPGGAWGDTGVRMWVDESGVAIETDCSHGKIAGPVLLDPQGRFSAEGTYSFEGGPTPEDGFPVHRVLYSGLVEKGQMTLTIRFVVLSLSQEIRLTATQGVSGQLNKCL